MSSGYSPNLRFGPFELDVRLGELRKGGARIRLPEQPFTILVMLLERQGDLVSRDEIRARLWPDTTVVEFDHSINAAVKRLRDTLRDSADQPRYIETLPRRGYRFIAQVERSEAAVEVPNVLLLHQQPPPMSGGRIGRMHRWGAAACVAALITIVGVGSL